MAGTEIVTAVVQILVSGFTGIGTGIGGALSSMATSIFLTGTGESQTLSVFAVLLVVFSSISLSLSLCRWVLNWIASFGNRNR